MAGVADEVKVARVAVRRLEARASFAEIDLTGNAGFHHPLQRPVDGGPADAGGLLAHALEQIVGADMPLLAEEHLDDPISLAGPFAAGWTKHGKVGKLARHLVNWRNRVNW